MYADDVNRILQRARLLSREPFGQAEAASLCFDLLASFPDHAEANELVYDAFCNRELIREQRRAIGRLIDEWDDRTWQQRRRLALSFRHMSRWEGKESTNPLDVADLLREGHNQLIQDYLLGQAKGSELAWPIFQAAIQRTSEPDSVLLWVGEQYAEQGFFAEAVEVLDELIARFPKHELGRRLWAEVRWWRDNQHRIPWVPPSSRENGRLYRRMMADIDPELATAEPILPHQPPNQTQLPPDLVLFDTLPEALIAEITAVLDTLPPLQPTSQPLVNWDYLAQLESGDIDTSQFPAWAQYLLLEIDNPQQEQFLKRYLLEWLINATEEE